MAVILLLKGLFAKVMAQGIIVGTLWKKGNNVVTLQSLKHLDKFCKLKNQVRVLLECRSYKTFCSRYARTFFQTCLRFKLFSKSQGDYQKYITEKSCLSFSIIYYINKVFHSSSNYYKNQLFTILGDLTFQPNRLRISSKMIIPQILRQLL